MCMFRDRAILVEGTNESSIGTAHRQAQCRINEAEYVYINGSHGSHGSQQRSTKRFQFRLTRRLVYCKGGYRYENQIKRA